MEQPARSVRTNHGPSLFSTPSGNSSELTPISYYSLEDNPMFYNDAVMPAQFERDRTEKPAAGERRLMLAILEDAFRCLTGKGVERKKSTSGADSRVRLFRDAQAWVFSTRRDHIYTFENICDFLDMDAEVIRAKLRARGGRLDKVYRTRIVATAPQIRMRVRNAS